MREFHSFRGFILGFAVAVPTLLQVNCLYGATSMAAGLDDGYSTKVLEKALKTFSPAAELGSGKIGVRVFIDGDGKYYDCRVYQSSGNQNIDKAFCANLKKASPFGQPPYGQPAEVTLTFIEDKNAVRSQPAIQQAKPVPQGEAISPADRQKYLDASARQIRNSVYIPAESAKGVYHPVARVKIDAQGKILDCSIAKSSGDKTMDKYLLQGIKRAGKISPPPRGMGTEFELPFTLAR